LRPPKRRDERTVWRQRMNKSEREKEKEERRNERAEHSDPSA
jgi:hypothetical protein